MIEVNDLTGKFGEARLVRRVARIAANALKITFPVSFVIVGSRRIMAVNARYRRKAKPTNVLAFKYSYPQETGEVFLCPAIIRREAQKQKLVLKTWLSQLVVHGMLHLAGYTHDTTKQARAMERRAQGVMRLIEFRI